MTRAAAPSLLRAPARFFLAVVVAVGLLIGAAASASAASPPAAQNVVGASTVTLAPLVGPSGDVSPAMSRDSYDSQAQTASATGVAANTSAFSNLTHSSSGIAPYSVQRTVTAGQGGSIQAHHLIERRFADVMGQSVADMPAVVVTRAEHQVFTNAWREAIPYGPSGTGRAYPAQVEEAARQIYREYPEILQALGLE